jgi:glycogen phosphorylase
MTRARKLDARGDGYVYAASVPASRSTGDFTPRIVAHHPHVMVPLEASEILWLR